MPVPIVPISLGVTALAAAIASYLRRLQALEEARTREHLQAQRRRRSAIKKAQATLRQANRKSHAASARNARRRAEYEARSLILDELTAIQRRCDKRIQEYLCLEKEEQRLRENLSLRWKEERQPALRLQFREIETGVCKFWWLLNKARLLRTECGSAKAQLTQRSLHFRDAARIADCLPDEAQAFEVPTSLPRRFDLVQAEFRRTKKGWYFKMPCGLKSHLEPAETVLTRRLATGTRSWIQVLRVDYPNSSAVVSPARARMLRSWRTNPNRAYPARVMGRNKGGYTVEVWGGANAFLPKSHMPKPIPVGETLKVSFVQLDPYFDSPVVTPSPPLSHSIAKTGEVTHTASAVSA